MNSELSQARRVGCSAAVALLALGAAACEDPQPPTACGESLPAVTVHVGETATVESCFSDANGDMLTYSAASSSPEVATVATSGKTITVTAKALGSATITITASDPGGLEGAQTFQAEVPNRAPTPVGTVSRQTAHVGETVTVDASQYFDDPDGEDLAYTVASSTPSVATASVSGSTVTVTALAPGTTDITITASDPGGLSATQNFQAEVPNRAPVAVGRVPQQTVEAGKIVTLDAAPYFDEPDGQDLSYTAASSNPSIASVAVAGSTVTLTGVAPGRAAVTISAADPGGLSAEQTADVTVLRPNRGPETVGSIPDQETTVDERVEFDAFLYFSDPDGDSLSYAARSSDAAVTVASMSGDTVKITGAAPGSATVTVTATDPGGLSAEQSTDVKIGPFSRDREALVALYDETGGDFWWTTDTNWLTYRPLRTWFGVTTNEDVRVVELDLSGNGVWGPIPRSITYLKGLERLDLSDNRVNGALPREIGDLRDLVELNLSDNTFLGSGTSIPAALSKLAKLERLSLSGTRFDDDIPKELANIESLTRLELADITFLDGSIPAEFGDLSNLTHLDVSESGLDGALPQALTKLSLEVFYWNRTSLCSPDNDEFQEWLDGIKDHKGGRKCTG